MSSPIRFRVLRSSAVLMAAGMLVFAAAGYAFVVLAGRSLPKDQATLATSFYFLANVVGPGIFFALEQATSRGTSAALASGAAVRPVARRSRLAGLRLLGVVTLALAALAPVIGAKTLHGDWTLYAEVLLTPAVVINLHYVRGLLAGRQLFGGYSATLASEGLSRLVLCGAVAVGGASRAWIFGLAYIGASAIAALVGLVALRTGRGAPQPVSPVAETLAAESLGAETPIVATIPVGDAAPRAEAAGARGFGRELAALAFASLFAQLLPNLAPLAVNSRLDAASALALTFAQAAVVARIPLLMFMPIQAMVLPHLTAAATRGDLAEVRTLMKRIIVITVGLGAAGAAVFAVAGSWALRTFFGATVDLSAATLLGLAVSTVILMATYALQPALVALGRNRDVMIGWGVGSAITGASAVLPFLAAVPAATVGQVAGPLATTALFVVVMARRLRSSTPTGTDTDTTDTDTSAQNTGIFRETEHPDATAPSASLGA